MPGPAATPVAEYASCGAAHPVRRQCRLRRSPTWTAISIRPTFPALLELAARNEAAINDIHYAKVSRLGTVVGLARRFWHALRANTRRGSARNIAYHYDLGNEFYRRWLDPSMAYSSAVFADGARDLETAQQAKFARMAAMLDVKPGERVLEIGCGWGSFAAYLAREFRAKVTAITVSREQLAHTQEKVQREGLGDLVEARFVDYRDVEGRFDRIASIEMFEAVGEKYWPAYFGKLRDSLAPGGRAALQIITIADRFFESYRGGVDFIQRYIFPRRHAALGCGTEGADRARGPCGGQAELLRPRLCPRRWPNGTAASSAHGRRSRGSASMRASSGCGSSTSPIARRDSARARST